jgi:hypothetical protein
MAALRSRLQAFLALAQRACAPRLGLIRQCRDRRQMEHAVCPDLDPAACWIRPVVPRTRFDWALSAASRNSCRLRRLVCKRATSLNSSRVTRRKQTNSIKLARWLDLPRLHRAPGLDLTGIGLLFGQRHGAQVPVVSSKLLQAVNLVDGFGKSVRPVTLGWRLEPLQVRRVGT